MKKLIFVLIAAIVLIGCETGTNARIRQEENSGYSVEYVVYSGKFVIVNDSIARVNMKNGAIFKKQMSNSGKYRYYRVK